MSKSLAVIFAVCVCAASIFAQNRVMVGHSSGAHGPGAAGRPVVPTGARTTGIRISGNGFERRGAHRPFRGGGFVGGYGWPYFYDDHAETYEPEPVAASQPAPVAPVQFKAEPVPDPVLLELRGNQWVKVESFTSAAVIPVKSAAAVPAQSSAPAVLVYRDGHSEELNSYSIIGPVIYTKGDYWSSGNWTRKIQIADLDLPATFKQNQDHGVKFELPSGPDEIMIRP
jgi:hypothetical protein